MRFGTLLALLPAALCKFAITSIADSIDGGIGLALADLDPSSSHVGVLAATVRDNSLTLFQHDGSDAFEPDVVTSAAVDAYAVVAADLDGDSDLDYVVASPGDNTVAWYENRRTAISSRHVLTTTVDGPAALAVADLNGDSRNDVVVASSWDNTIVVFMNSGDRTFQGRVVTREAPLVSAISIADMNADGSMDLLSGSGEGGEVTWWENDGSGSFTKRVISGDARVDGVASIAAADLDGDGDLDVVVASANTNTVVWFEASEKGSFAAARMHVITRDAKIPTSVALADLNHDSFVDVVVGSAGDGLVTWHKNDGEGRFEQNYTVSAAASGVYSLVAADVDRDLDPDLIIGLADGTIAWAENREDGAAFVEHTISSCPAVTE